MRLFIAIRFEENILNALTAFQNDMRTIDNTVRSKKKRLTNYRLDVKNIRLTHEQLLVGIF